MSVLLPNPRQPSLDCQLLEQLDNQGFVLIQNPGSVFQAAVNQAIAVLPHLYTDTDVKKIWRSQDGSPNHLVAPHLKYGEFREIICSSLMLDIIQLLWSQQRAHLYNSKVSFKKSGENQIWVPHQDSAYKSRPLEGITVCVFLTDCSAANGTLQVFPRSHKFGKLEHKLLSTGDCKYQLVVKQLPAIKPLKIEGATGTILVMSSHMIHQSRANKSTGDRPILIFEIERFQGFAIDEYEQLPLMLIGEMTTAERWRSRLTYSLKSDVLLARTKSLIRKTWKRS
jgi:hypothetical protein